MRLAAILTVVVVAVLCASASGAPGRTVTLGDRSITPETLRVPVNAKVEFVNRGKRPHRVVAERNLWPPFTLLPRAKATIQLYVAGVYPYKVDGRRKGEIIVGTPFAGFAPKPGSTMVAVTHRYSVRVEALIEESITFSGSSNPGSNGTETANLTWISRVPSLVITVQKIGDSTTIVTKPARGTFAGRLEFRETRAAAGACAGGVDYRLTSEVLLQGGKSGANGFATFSAGLPPAAADEYEAIREAATNGAGCPSFNDADWLDLTEIVDRGVHVHHPPSLSIAAWDTRWTAERRGIPFPLDKMIAGQSFSLDTGLRSFQNRSCGSGCSETFRGQAKYVFTALPPR